MRRATMEDAVLAVVVAAASAVSVAVADHNDTGQHTPAIGYVVLLASCAPLVLRRRWPVAVWAAVGVGTAAYGLADWVDPALPIAAMVAVYSVAAHSRLRVAVLTGAITLALAALAFTLDPSPHDLNDALVPVLAALAAWLAGATAASHRSRIALLEERARRVDHERALDAERAATAERLRIARDLHDLTAHHLTVIAVEAQAGRSVLPARVDEAAAMFDAIAGGSRAALAELRRTVGALRADTDADRHPLPGLRDLDALVADARRAGLRAELTCDGDPAGVPPSAGLAVYRVVQEALTNVRRHAQASAVVVELAVSPAAVVVTVEDDGIGPGAGVMPGNGLTGMRERVHLAGGELAIAGGPGGRGVSVRATLPR